MSKAISEIFDVEPIETTSAAISGLADSIMTNVPAEVVPSSDIITAPKFDNETEKDIDLARDNLKELMKVSSKALQEAMSLAINSENPKAFEVVSGIIAASSELSTKLVDIHSTKSKMGGSTKGALPGNQTTNNNLFVGTPAELAKLLKGNT